MYKTLLQLGCRPSLRGFKYLQHAINYVLEHENTYIGEVYWDVAKENKSNYSKVERCIRHCIQSAALQGDMQLWEQVFGYVINKDTGCVTNKDFIWGLAEYLKYTSGDTKYWIATLTEDGGDTTWTMKVTGATYTDALMNVVKVVDKSYIMSDYKKAIMDLQPLNFKA